jgi:hypothetical protein
LEIEYSGSLIAHHLCDHLDMAKKALSDQQSHDRRHQERARAKAAKKTISAPGTKAPVASGEKSKP